MTETKFGYKYDISILLFGDVSIKNPRRTTIGHKSISACLAVAMDMHTIDKLAHQFSSRINYTIISNI
jgi:hypothetical protein